MMKIGYIIASNHVMKEGENICFLYREKPDNENDSGWRVFSGKESQEYVDDPKNFAIYNATTVTKLCPELTALLGTDFPATFERNSVNGKLENSKIE